MADVVYALCALTSIACAVLLVRAFRQSRVKLLLWSGVCFGCLAVNNVLLFLDLSVFPEVDLSLLRMLPIVVGLAVLLWGLIWDSKPGTR